MTTTQPDPVYKNMKRLQASNDNLKTQNRLLKKRIKELEDEVQRYVRWSAVGVHYS